MPQNGYCGFRKLHLPSKSRRYDKALSRCYIDGFRARRSFCRSQATHRRLPRHLVRAVEDADLGEIVVGLLRGERELTRLETLHFIFDREFGKPKQDVKRRGWNCPRAYARSALGFPSPGGFARACTRLRWDSQQARHGCRLGWLAQSFCGPQGECGTN